MLRLGVSESTSSGEVDAARVDRIRLAFGCRVGAGFSEAPRLGPVAKLLRGEELDDLPVRDRVDLDERLLGHLVRHDAAAEARVARGAERIHFKKVKRPVLDELAGPVLAPRPLHRDVVLRRRAAVGADAPEEAVRADDGHERIRVLVEKRGVASGKVVAARERRRALHEAADGAGRRAVEVVDDAALGRRRVRGAGRVALKGHGAGADGDGADLGAVR
mmetsp:Transcript_32141/g.108199  ORF Transcript_32141/g.108199 Transcript_32141/m.108199 type:complete len:219 (+) Transcript_32141:1172-1828(+)